MMGEEILPLEREEGSEADGDGGPRPSVDRLPRLLLDVGFVTNETKKGNID